MTHVPLEHITEDTFSKFARTLLVLTCSHCLISEIDDNAFRKLENLQQLSLDNNKLKEVKASWFEGLSYLTYLDLNYNEIEKIDGDVFRLCPDLVDLRLSGNRLQCLDLEAMSKLRELKRIFITDNPRFACPNALKRFLEDRSIEFERDSNWDSMPVDQVVVSEPPRSFRPVSETTQRYYPTRGRWASETPYYTTTTVGNTEPVYYAPPMAVSPGRAPYPPETAYTGQDYYTQKVTQQQMDQYRQYTQGIVTNGTSTVQTTNPSRTTVGALQNHTQTTLPTTTTECPNGTGYSYYKAGSSVLGIATIMALIMI